MKAVSNVKNWDERGWFYHMVRIVDGKPYAYDLLISKYEMHYRDTVAWKLRHARHELASRIDSARNQTFT